MVGFGPLESVVAAPGVTDVAVTPDGRVWTDDGDGMHEVMPSIPFDTPERVKEYAIQLCSQMGRRLDDSCPITDASTPSGIRVHAVIEPLVLRGASISIRVPPLSALTLKDLEQRGFLPHIWCGILRRLVRAKASIIISGGTGTGKTTLLRALLTECAADERIVAIEEIREIGGVNRGDFVSLVSRESNVEGAGGISLSQLVTATLRMRPDRIVLGECRGEEVADLLRAFNTGHRGGLVTIHANGVEQLPQRLVALGQLSGLPASSLFMLAEGAFDAILHIERVRGVRRLAQIGRMAQGSLAAQGLSAAQGVSSASPSALPMSPTSASSTGLRGQILSTWDGAGVPMIYSGWDEFSAQWNLEREP